MKKYILFSLVLFLSSHTWADNRSIISELSTLVEQHRYEDAFNLAQEHSAELEGDSQFDFLYGFSALQIGKFEPALFSFERLSASHPQVQRYRLELARSYFYLDNLEQAEKEFERILASNPPANVQANIQRFLDAIAAKRQALQSRTQTSLTLAAGYDSNFNSATDAQKIALFDGLFYATLSPAQRRQDSPFMQLRAISSHSRPLSRLSSWDVLAYFNHRWVSEDNDYSLSGAGAQIGSRHLFGAWQLRPSLNLTQYLLGGEEYQQDLSLSGDVFWQISPQFQPFARLSLLRLDNKINNDTDKLRPQIESGSSFNFGALNGQISVNYGQDFKAHRSAIYMRDGLGASLQAQYRWGFGDIYTQLLWQSSQYQEKMALFSKREDNFGLLLLGYRQHLNSQFSLYAQVSQSENDSTVKLYQYSRTLAETGLTWAF